MYRKYILDNARVLLNYRERYRFFCKKVIVPKKVVYPHEVAESEEIEVSHDIQNIEKSKDSSEKKINKKTEWGKITIDME